jgi:pantoate--beta-alanine ligase
MEGNFPFAMKIITSVPEMEAARAGLRGAVGLVPTMGYLHEGHLSLVRQATTDDDHVIVSIFVNPTQFGPKEDLARYPRDLDRDLRLLEAERVHAVFFPSVEEIYPPGFGDWIEVHGPLTERLEGAHRPGHFRGVTTVVARLFGIVRPHHAYFGQKDAQQLRVIRRMVAEPLALRLSKAHPEALEGRVEIVAMPTVREPDGLAMSSRNVYLSPEEREAALAIPRALALARRLVMQADVTDAEAVRTAIRDFIRVDASRRDAKLAGRAAVEATPPGRPEEQRLGARNGGGVRRPARPRRDRTAQPEALVPAHPEVSKGRVEPSPVALDYVSISDEQTLEELQTIDRPALVLLAARVGTTRLIDNTVVIPRGVSIPDDIRELSNADAASLPLTTDR